MTEKLLSEEKKALISAAVSEIRRRTSEACPDREITLMAVTKTVPAEMINYAINECGITDIGENRVQELLGKYGSIDRDKVKIHFIGTLQPNKVKYIIDKVCLIHSLDSIRLAEEINKRAAAAGIVMDVLAELNIGNEQNKGGISPGNIIPFVDEVLKFPNIRLCGLMTIGPLCADRNIYHDFFSETYKIFIDICKRKLHNIDKPILSMGMSDNYDIAVQCGSTLIRPGSAIFGKRS